ncbi:hypothetical protein F4677DRAFT_408098 [Hypoxylon crocopeplum]|nr:hypothetical protein F4677DRAFT_408098 [Hypoxylon crocopeplum]
MLTPAFCNITSFFYPIGNSPAVSLTQDIPPSVPADILLLGCGDVRHILLTSHVDARRMDITCCDSQRAVIARNILLLSLLLDDVDKNEYSIWCIYYHLYLDQNALDLLRSQAKKLLNLSATIDAWTQSDYGRQFRLCDSATLIDIRKMWMLYSSEPKGAELSRFRRRFESALQRSKDHRQDRFGGNSVTVTGFRAASPAYITALGDLDSLHKHYWKHGSTELKKVIREKAKHPNPMFLTLEDEATFHYSSDPLLGFHLATAYAPLSPNSPSAIPNGGMSQLERVVATARAEFREWVTSFRRHSASIVVRFFIGDAISFAHTLQHKRIASVDTAGWCRNRYSFAPLVLDGSDYQAGSAPFTFDVIDTSNLCDHLGSLILLTAVTPLLRNHPSSVLYAEVLAKFQNYREVLDNVVCGHVPTMSILLGLFPVDYWTNTTSLSADEEFLCSIMGDQERRQMFLRTTWKRPIVSSSPSGSGSGLVKMQFDAEQLAQVLYKVYLYIFRDEDYTFKFANISLDILKSSSIVWYQRASFAAFLSLVKTRTKCDWDAAMNVLVLLIENRQNAPMGMNYLQELFTYLHLLGVFSTDMLRDWHSRKEMSWGFNSIFERIVSRIIPVDEKWGDLRDWKNIPPVVCVTLKVPRNKLSVLAAKRVQMGTPPVHCTVEGPASAGMNTWQNIFPACQMVFGDMSSRGAQHDDSFEVSVVEDEIGWNGTSALIVSFYAPSFFLLLEPRKARVTFGIASTQATTMHFCRELGMTLSLYTTTLDNSANVYITRYVPHQSSFPIISGFAAMDLVDPSSTNPGTDLAFSAEVDQHTGRIEQVTSRLNITSKECQSTLRSCKVQTAIVSPCQVAVTLEPTTLFVVYFPSFITENIRTRIARTSCYIEVIARIATSSEWIKHPNFMYPVHVVDGKAVNWNMPYLDLRSCPIIDTKQAKKLDWFTPHVSLAISSRERVLRENINLHRSSGEQTRLDFKASILTMFNQFVQFELKKRQVFGLYNATNGGNHILIMVSGLRLDRVNRTVVLDCAILPLCTYILPKLSKFIPVLHSKGLSQIKVDDAELRLWKQALPAYVERCRTWEHRGACEYATDAKVPLTLENGELFLCTCGNGEFPADFFTGMEYWNTVSQYAVRAAISPPFWAPYADEVYNPPLPQTAGGCATCGKEKRENGTELLYCSRCKKVQYCSSACQRAHWVKHKGECNEKK